MEKVDGRSRVGRRMEGVEGRIVGGRMGGGDRGKDGRS